MHFDGKGCPEGIGQEQLKQLLTRGWMTHDGMWFMQVLSECGIETANKLNLAAINAMAPIEIKRVSKALGIENVNNHKSIRKLLTQGISLQIGDFMSFEWEMEPGVLTIDMENCFAHQGMVMMGCADEYQCGIFERIVAWLEALGLRAHMEPADKRCLMHHTGRCHREVHYSLPE